ncbi:glycolate oxidase FAD binding subunit [Roseibium hamelinense]|uniref:Glycolate oxidase FAD binding subunit n=1 Tax=Roseibium hamelinense TaxID=150831 RepID=A0A562T1J6_9HYPH|nr:glycolate oxidase subunit GlcE [Roseibium hamelinense]MTI43349.1 glycolate oxidase subunit GlcE [Roseibium hamelinense]TWI87549.1 glycolate oxidase FAD binding subunit [Roseibium hamelinense]
MDASFQPASVEDLRELIKWAAAEATPLEVFGSGSKRTLGRQVQAAHALTLSKLAGVDVYEPAELVMTAKAGTPIADIERLVQENGQELSFEPIDYGRLLGLEPGQGTLGGVLTANLSGPRRIKAGAARDHILGMEAVSGRGEIFNSGGRVVKNVTGYDLPRALCGSWGTLAVASTVTIKVNPASQTSETLVLTNLDDARAVKAMCKAMGSSAEVSGAAHLPNGLNGEGARTYLRLEGFVESVRYRRENLARLLDDFGPVAKVQAEETAKIWRSIKDVEPFWSNSGPVWRISVAPTAGPVLVGALSKLFQLEAFYDWSGGLVWLNCSDGRVHDVDIRRVIGTVGGGHGTLIRADAAQRASTQVFQPQPASLAALSQRLKEQFDPKGILNPGRMGSQTQ